MSIFEPETLEEYLGWVDEHLTDPLRLSNKMAVLSRLIWQEGKTTGDSLKDWAIVNLGFDVVFNFYTGLKSCHNLEEHIKGKEGELILVHENWEHSGKPGHKLYLGILSGEGLKVTREEHFDPEDYSSDGRYTKWDPRYCEQPLLLEACLKKGSKLYEERYDVYWFGSEEPIKDNIKIETEQKPLVISARIFKNMRDERWKIGSKDYSHEPEFSSYINLLLLQDREYIVNDAYIMVGTERVLEYMKKISKNPKITAAEKPEELIELLK